MKNSINYIIQKIKGLALAHKEEILVSLIIILVGSASYGAGVLSAKEGHPPIEIRDSGVVQSTNTKADKVATSTANSASAIEAVTTNTDKPSHQGEIVASKGGVAYYLPGCTGASRILDKNKIYFKTEADALSAGYHISPNCKR